MKRFTLAWIAALGLWGMVSVVCGATTYYVSTAGDDAASGVAPEDAFATIQRGVDVLEPGDTLIVLPGEYFGATYRKGLGSADAVTTIQAAIPGAAVIRGDLALDGFVAVPGMPGVYVVDFVGDVQAVVEVDTLHRLNRQVDAGELQFSPGSYYYDAEAGKLYISTSDFLPVGEHVYRVSVTAANGILIEDGRNVVIDGLVATGFMSADQQRASPGGFAVWGINVFQSEGCTIRNCIAYLNGGGIVVSASRGNNVIVDCIGYGNHSPHSEEGGNIIFFTPKAGDRIRGCLAYLSPAYGLRLYGNGEGETAIEDCIGWGNLADFFVKGAHVEKYATVYRSVAHGLGHAKNTVGCYIGGQNIYQAPLDAPADTIRRQRESINEDKEFVDPVNFDYRLQSTSKFRGALEDGSDAGPYQFDGTVFFVSPSGDDAADGMSVGTAWKSFGRAAAALRPGDTLYLVDGEYDAGMVLSIGATDGPPITIVARGAGNVVLNGKLRLENAAQIVFTRLIFSASVEVSGGEAITFSSCRFAPQSGVHGTAVAGLVLRHCAFESSAGSQLVLNDCRDVVVSSNLFFGPVVSNGSTIFYSDYNGYVEAAGCWVVDGKTVALAGLRDRQDKYSTDLSAAKEGAGVAAVSLLGRGAHGKPIGPYRDTLDRTLRMTPPTVYSVSATTANIEWVLTQPATTVVAWGETPECENVVKVNTTARINRHGCFSLTGLKPDTEYFFRIKELEIPRSQLVHGAPRIADPRYEVISFRTAASDPEPCTYHVAPDGDDRNSGLSKENAWRTLRHAAATAGPGDTVLVHEGIYSQLVRFRKTGDVGKPITFRSAPGERALLDSDKKRLDRAVVLTSKHNVHLDRLYAGPFQLGNWHTGIFDINESDNVKVTRIFFDGRGYGYCSSFLSAVDCDSLLVSNCVIINGIYGIDVSGGNDVVIENSIFLRNMIEATRISTSGKNNVFRNNIVFDSGDNKKGVWLHIWGGQNSIIDENNCYVIRLPDEQRKLFWMLNFEENGENLGHTRMGLAEYSERVHPTTSVIADPQLAVMEGVEVGDRFLGDVVFGQRPLDFHNMMTTNPELAERNIGLDPSQFLNDAAR